MSGSHQIDSFTHTLDSLLFPIPDGFVGINDAGSRVFIASAADFGRPGTIFGPYTAALSANGYSE